MPQYRDPVHGFIEITDEEQRIVDSAPFQRLRFIRQLATTYLVYHGAEHTRFGHSIGVLHLVTRAFDTVMVKHPLLFSAQQSENEALTAWYRQMLRLLALTHDLGHAPFSHASEQLFQGGRTHEDYSYDILQKTEIHTILNDISDRFTTQYGPGYEITPTLLWALYGKAPLPQAASAHKADFEFLRGFMDGEMDCDKMDYLLRDSHFCGVSYGVYDLERFLTTITVYRRPGGAAPLLAINRGGLQAFEEFVLARYFMFIQVYFHKTRRYLDHLLSQCLAEVLPGGQYPVDIEDYLALDDIEILHRIKLSNAAPCVAYRHRQIMTCVRETPVHAVPGERAVFDEICRVLCRELPADAIYIDEADKAAHRLQPLRPYETGDDKVVYIIDRRTGTARSIMQDSLILEGIARPISVHRLYVRKEYLACATARIDRVCAEAPSGNAPGAQEK